MNVLISPDTEEAKCWIAVPHQSMEGDCMTPSAIRVLWKWSMSCSSPVLTTCATINDTYYMTGYKQQWKLVELCCHFPPGQCSNPSSWYANYVAGLGLGGAGTPSLLPAPIHPQTVTFCLLEWRRETVFSLQIPTTLSQHHYAIWGQMTLVMIGSVWDECMI